MTLELLNARGQISAVVVKDRRPVEQPCLLDRTTDESPLFAIANAPGYWVTPADSRGYRQTTVRRLLRAGPLVADFHCPACASAQTAVLSALFQ